MLLLDWASVLSNGWNTQYLDWHPETADVCHHIQDSFDQYLSVIPTTWCSELGTIQRFYITNVVYYHYTIGAWSLRSELNKYLMLNKVMKTSPQLIAKQNRIVQYNLMPNRYIYCNNPMGLDVPQAVYSHLKSYEYCSAIWKLYGQDLPLSLLVGSARIELAS